MNDLGNVIQKQRNFNFKPHNLVNYLSTTSIVILCIVFTSINSNFLSPLNIRNILTDIAPLLAMSCGVTFVLYLGSIDLSLGSICSCSVILITVLLQQIGVWAYLVVLIFGFTAGFINGFAYIKLKVPSFIVTLCAASIWQTVAYLLSGGAPMPMPPKIWGMVKWGKFSIGILPMLFIISVIVVFALYIVQSRLTTGRAMYAIGANERAARIAGLNVDMAKVVAFIFSGIGSALAGIFFAVKLKSGIPTVGEPYTMMAIAAAALGGTAVSGGSGSVLKTILGVALVTVIQNGLNISAVDAFWQQIVFGLLVLFALYMNADRSGRDLVIK